MLSYGIRWVCARTATLNFSHKGKSLQIGSLPTNKATLPTLAQFNGAVCWVIHVSQLLVLSFIYNNTPRTVQTHLTTFSITLFQLTPLALGIPEYPSDVPHWG